MSSCVCLVIYDLLYQCIYSPVCSVWFGLVYFGLVWPPELGALEAMAVQGAQEAMTVQGSQEAMAVQGAQEAMAGGPSWPWPRPSARPLKPEPFYPSPRKKIPWGS